MVSFSELRERAENKVEQHREAYIALAFAVAEGKSPAIEKIEAILQNAEKSPDDLERDVAIINTYTEMLAKAGRLPECVERRKALGLQVEDAKQAFNAAGEALKNLSQQYEAAYRAEGFVKNTADEARHFRSRNMHLFGGKWA